MTEKPRGLSNLEVQHGSRWNQRKHCQAILFECVDAALFLSARIILFVQVTEVSNISSYNLIHYENPIYFPSYNVQAALNFLKR